MGREHRGERDRTRPPKAVLVLSENWTLVDPRDLRAVVQIAIDAEAAGVDAVMLSEHVVLGGGADAAGPMGNPRDYAAPGNQSPDYPWPDSIVLAGAIAGATTRLRIALAAIIAPLRHPLLLAKALATLDLLSEGRLVVQPTVSWHEAEYAALGVSFADRGALLDEHLIAWQAAWRPGPATFHGAHYRFDDVHVSPKPWRPEGPALWFGGQSLHAALLRRLVTYGSGFHPFGTPSAADHERLRAGLLAAGRDPAAIEHVGGIRGRFPDDTGVADLDEALASVPAQLARGATAICFKPSMFTDDPAEVGAISRRVVAGLAAASAATGATA